MTDDIDAICAEINRRLMARKPTLYSLRPRRQAILPVLPRIECADGFSLSVQADYWSDRCSPKSSVGPWKTVEVAFTSAPAPELHLWQSSVKFWDYVPIREVARLIANHGGLKS